MIDIVKEYKTAISLQISPSTVDCAKEVFWKLEEEYQCPEWLLEDVDFMTDVLDYSSWMVCHIDWQYGMGHDEWDEIASDIAREYCLQKVDL